MKRFQERYCLADFDRYNRDSWLCFRIFRKIELTRSNYRRHIFVSSLTNRWIRAKTIFWVYFLVISSIKCLVVSWFLSVWKVLWYFLWTWSFKRKIIKTSGVRQFLLFSNFLTNFWDTNPNDLNILFISW